MNEIKWEKHDEVSMEVAVFLFEYFKEGHSLRSFSGHMRNADLCIVGIVDEEIVAAEVSAKNEIMYSAVRESFRGKGLQMELMSRSLWFIRKNNNEFSYAYMYVRAKNIASLKNALKIGFKIERLILYDLLSGMQDGYQLGYLLNGKALIDPKL